MKLLIITQKVDENDQLLGFFTGWLKGFSQKFKKLIVLCLEKGEYDLPSNVKVISLGKEREKFQSIFNIKIFKKVKYLARFYSYIYQERKNYDSVFIHMNPIWVVAGGPYWRLTGKKIFFWYTSGGVTLKLKWAEKFADIIFTASKESFRLPSKKIIVTGHGIDTDVFRPTPKNVRDVRGVGNDGNEQFEQAKRSNTSNNFIKILSVGRIAPVKNYETLIDAAKILKDSGVDFFVTIVGEAALKEDKKYQENLEFRIKNLELEKYFNFVGKVTNRNLPNYYQKHDIFIHLSKTGSLDKVILEAMACGCNMLSSSDSSRKFLEDNSVFKEDDPRDLADKIKNLRSADHKRELRNYILENHDLNKLISKISTIINDS